MGISFALLVVIDESFIQPSNSGVLLTIMLAAYLGYMVVCGMKGNEWLRRSLERRGYARVESKPNDSLQPTAPNDGAAAE